MGHPTAHLVNIYYKHPLLVSRYDKQLQQIDGTLSTIEMQREALEGANTNTAVLTTMNDAAKALKKANADLDVDKVVWFIVKRTK